MTTIKNNWYSLFNNNPLGDPDFKIKLSVKRGNKYSPLHKDPIKLDTSEKLRNYAKQVVKTKDKNKKKSQVTSVTRTLTSYISNCDYIGVSSDCKYIAAYNTKDCLIIAIRILNDKVDEVLAARTLYYESWSNEINEYGKEMSLSNSNIHSFSPRTGKDRLVNELKNLYKPNGTLSESDQRLHDALKEQRLIYEAKIKSLEDKIKELETAQVEVQEPDSRIIESDQCMDYYKQYPMTGQLSNHIDIHQLNDDIKALKDIIDDDDPDEDYVLRRFNKCLDRYHVNDLSIDDLYHNYERTMEQLIRVLCEL
ncbi:hypothetical protein [Vibrio harveyi]|uniref:hypothetical protein n=3 Tax=Vibrio harveyi TaxID=669 RepID=UPI00075E7058|nr:hypothetical protein [Vibrio harveyi]PNM43646.1 hypothetical protein AL469_027745 [Vibrio harveyi]